MKIAVTYENGQIFQHFGHSENFKIYDIKDNAVISSKVVNTNGFAHGALAGFLGSEKINKLICGGIGGGAISALGEAGIEVMAGVNGDADAAIEKYLKNALAFTSSSNCNHTEGEAHSCGDHGCGK